MKNPHSHFNIDYTAEDEAYYETLTPFKRVARAIHEAGVNIAHASRTFEAGYLTPEGAKMEMDASRNAILREVESTSKYFSSPISAKEYWREVAPKILAQAASRVRESHGPVHGQLMNTIIGRG